MEEKILAKLLAFHNFKNKKFSSIAWIMAVLVIVIAVILNMIVSQLDLGWDVSPNKQYSLGKTTTAYLDELDQNGTKIDFYVLAKMDDIKDSVDTLALYRALKEYDEHDCINLIDIDPNSDEATMEKINPDNALTLNTGDMVLVCGDTKKRIPGNTMYTTNSDDNGNAVSQTFNGENILTGAIKSVVDGFTPTVYFLTGHGEKSADDNYTQFKKNLQNYNYAAKSLLLSDVDAVPSDAAMVLVAAPTSDISDSDKDKLDAYLNEGGNLSLLMSPNAGTFNYTNLDLIMEEFSIIMDYDTVKETDASMHVSGDDSTIQCNLVELSSDSEAADLTSSLINQGLVPYMTNSRSFYFDTDTTGTLTTAELLTTNDTAVGEPNGGAYDTKKITNSELMLAGYSQSNTKNNAKLAVFGNADFLDDTHLQDSRYIVAVYLYLSTISWMYDTDVDMGIDSKSTVYDEISLPDANSARSLMIVFAALPVAIIIIGVGVWVKRRNS